MIAVIIISVLLICLTVCACVYMKTTYMPNETYRCIELEHLRIIKFKLNDIVNKYNEFKSQEKDYLYSSSSIISELGLLNLTTCPCITIL